MKRTRYCAGRVQLMHISGEVLLTGCCSSEVCSAMNCNLDLQRELDSSMQNLSVSFKVYIIEKRKVFEAYLIELYQLEIRRITIEYVVH